MRRPIVMLASALLLETAAGCDRPAEPAARSAPRSSPSTLGSPAVAVPNPPSRGASSDRRATAPLDDRAGRCVEPTPAAPVRPPVRGVDERCPDDPTGRFDLRRAKIVVTGANVELDVEVAEDDRSRARGLMYRRSMGEGEGMLFVFEQRRAHRFWMKNTCIPLDMLFIDRDGLIVGIEENVPTLNIQHYRVDCPSLYVLEVNAGWSRRHGVKAGDVVQLEGV